MNGNSDFVIENGVLNEYHGPGGDVTIPAGVTEIGEWAFEDCRGLTSVTIPASVKKIDRSAFQGCEYLTIHAPAGSYAEQYAKKCNIPFVAE